MFRLKTKFMSLFWLRILKRSVFDTIYIYIYIIDPLNFYFV